MNKKKQKHKSCPSCGHKVAEKLDKKFVLDIKCPKCSKHKLSEFIKNA